MAIECYRKHCYKHSIHGGSQEPLCYENECIMDKTKTPYDPCTPFGYKRMDDDTVYIFMDGKLVGYIYKSFDFRDYSNNFSVGVCIKVGEIRLIEKINPSNLGFEKIQNAIIWLDYNYEFVQRNYVLMSIY